jgi:hypothetical protein
VVELLPDYRPTLLPPSPHHPSSTNLGLLPQADHGWREARADLHFWFTRDYSAALPSQWAQQVLGHNLLLGLPSHLDTALSHATHPIQRHSLQTATAIPRVPRPTYALLFAFSYQTNFVTTPSAVKRCLSFLAHTYFHSAYTNLITISTVSARHITGIGRTSAGRIHSVQWSADGTKTLKHSCHR